MRNLLTTIFAFVLLVLPVIVLADSHPLEYDDSLVTIPGYEAGGGFQSFINVVYGLSISIAALLAVVKIVIAGVKWMLSDVVTSKAEAKKDIQSALFGLIIIISAVLVISLINPEIVS